MSAAFFDPTMYSSALQQVQSAASAAYQAAMYPVDAPRFFIRAAWEELVRRNQVTLATGGPDAQMAAAVEARDVMIAIHGLAPHHKRALDETQNRREAGKSNDFAVEAAGAAAAIASSAILAKFQAERDRARKQREAEAEATQQAINALMLRDAPQNLLISLRSRGMELGLSADGKHITALPKHHALMQQTEVEAIKERRADFLALLKAEAVAAAPVIIV